MPTFHDWTEIRGGWGCSPDGDKSNALCYNVGDPANPNDWDVSLLHYETLDEAIYLQRVLAVAWIELQHVNRCFKLYGEQK